MYSAVRTYQDYFSFCSLYLSMLDLFLIWGWTALFISTISENQNVMGKNLWKTKKWLVSMLFLCPQFCVNESYARSYFSLNQSHLRETRFMNEGSCFVTMSCTLLCTCTAHLSLVLNAEIWWRVTSHDRLAITGWLLLPMLSACFGD